MNVRDEVAHLVKSGYTDLEVAKQVDRSRDRVKHIRLELGLPVNWQPKADVKRIARMSEEGVPVEEIARTLGISPDTARKYRTGAPLPRGGEVRGRHLELKKELGI